MLNFAVGPVMMDEKIKKIGAEEIPYFRTAEFSSLMHENEDLILKFFNAPENSKVVFLTTSGTGAMESAVMNSFGENDKVLVVNGGSFGHRFVQICQIHNIQYEEIKLTLGETLKASHLEKYENAGFTGFLVNLHETSTGVLYDIELISNFCKRNNLFLIVDCISAFLADKFDMKKSGVNIALTGSQKALAVAPGIAVVVLDECAVERAKRVNVKSLYFNYVDYLKDMERGQTPFTPAVGILIQINERLKEIDKSGLDFEIERVRLQAQDFRSKIAQFDFEFFSENMSNAVTSLRVSEDLDAHKIFEILKDEYNIFICPNGGDLAQKVFRVGHIGNLSHKDNDTLINALQDMKKRGLI